MKLALKAGDAVTYRPINGIGSYRASVLAVHPNGTVDIDVFCGGDPLRRTGVPLRPDAGACGRGECYRPQQSIIAAG